MKMRSQTKARPAMKTAPTGGTFNKVRSDHASETAEDYVEAVSDILHKHGECRVQHLADLMGVSHVTISRAVARLQQHRLVVTEPYKPIRLTARGERLAAESRRRHEIVLLFLQMLGVPDEDSQRDAEGIEHHVGKATLKCMQGYIDQNANTKKDKGLN